MIPTPGRRDPYRRLPLAILAALGWLALFPVTSVDVDYHLATGRRILQDGAIPERGVGSATFGQAAWHDNEWGFQLVTALLAPPRRDGDGVWVISPNGTVALVLLRAACLVLTLALLSAHMARQGVDPLSRSLGLVLAAFLTFGNLFWAVRPQIFSYLLLAAVAYLLERDRAGSRWAAWAVPAVLALWANLHGAFVIGIVLLATEALGEWIESVRAAHAGQVRQRARRLTLLTVVAPVAVCLNPFGYHQLVHPFLYVLHPEIYRGNAEWTRPDFLHLPLLVLTLAVLILGLVRRPRVPIPEVLRVTVFCGLLLTAIRHLPMAVLVVVPVALASLTGAARRSPWLLPTAPASGGTLSRGVAAVMIAIAIVSLSGAKFVGLLPHFEQRPVRAMPERAVRLIAREDPDGAIFNTYRFGGFLMYRLFPGDVAFMDGRNDLYGTFRDAVYNRILWTEPGWRAAWRDAVARYDVRWVLLEERDPLAAALAGDPDWIMGADGTLAVVDGTPGRDGIVLTARSEPGTRARLSAAIRRAERARGAPSAHEDPP